MVERLPVCFGQCDDDRAGGHEPAGMAKIDTSGFGTIYQCVECGAIIRHHYKYDDSET